jgi:putative FmdB family regulatory protein
MPIFEYICSKCGRKFEFLEKPGHTGRKTCPECGSGKLEKQLSVFNAGVKEGDSKRCYGCSDYECPHSRN